MSSEKEKGERREREKRVREKNERGEQEKLYTKIQSEKVKKIDDEREREKERILISK